VADCLIPLEIVAQGVRWLNPHEVSVPAPRITYVDDDGEEKTELLHGVDRWDYENQPARQGKG
jgi:hypothetical protein